MADEGCPTSVLFPDLDLLMSRGTFQSRENRGISRGVNILMHPGYGVSIRYRDEIVPAVVNTATPRAIGFQKQDH